MSKDSKCSLIWNHFTEIGSENANMIRSVCNHYKKELKCSWTGTTSSMTFETDNNYSIPFEISNNSSSIRFNSK